MEESNNDLPVKDYKIPVDKDLIYEALLLHNQDVSEAHIAELKKVHNIIMIRYHQKWHNMADDLFHRCLECVFVRKKHYNPKFSAYNFVYTMFRNETGNYIKKHFREEDALETDTSIFANEVYEEQEETDISQEFLVLQRYEQYLSGAADYTYIRIPKDIVIDLTTTLLKLHKKSICHSLKQIDSDLLYTILLNMIK